MIIGVVKNPIHHDRTKHVEIHRHFIKEKIDASLIDLNYASISNQVADMLIDNLHYLCDIRGQIGDLISLINCFDDVFPHV